MRGSRSVYSNQIKGREMLYTFDYKDRDEMDLNIPLEVIREKAVRSFAEQMAEESQTKINYDERGLRRIRQSVVVLHPEAINGIMSQLKTIEELAPSVAHITSGIREELLNK